MPRFRTLALLLAGLAVTAQPAAAWVRHHRHHRAYVLREPALAPAPTPIPDPQVPNRSAGYFGGQFVTGILGAPAADPYDEQGFAHSDYGLPPIPRY